MTHKIVPLAFVLYILIGLAIIARSETCTSIGEIGCTISSAPVNIQPKKNVFTFGAEAVFVDSNTIPCDGNNCGKEPK